MIGKTKYIEMPINPEEAETLRQVIDVFQRLLTFNIENGNFNQARESQYAIRMLRHVFKEVR